MAEKKSTTQQQKKNEDRKVTLTNPASGKKEEKSIYDFLGREYFSQKQKGKDTYISVPVFRQILRQLPELGLPEYDEEQFVISGNRERTGKTYLYKKVVRVPYYDNDGNNIYNYVGVGYHAFSLNVLTSEGAHGNFKVLEAKALRDALKSSYPIFDYGQYLDEEAIIEEPKDKGEKVKEEKQVSAAQLLEEAEAEQEQNKEKNKISDEDIKRFSEETFKDSVKDMEKITIENLRNLAKEVQKTYEIPDKDEKGNVHPQKRIIGEVLDNYKEKYLNSNE